TRIWRAAATPGSEVPHKIERNAKSRGGRAATPGIGNRSCDFGRPLGQRDGQCQGPSRCPGNDGSLEVLRKIDRKRRARGVTGPAFSNGMFVRRHRA
ncbi:hypothetical protein THAOC_26307, partial [Thalassiosira oceanica]